MSRRIATIGFFDGVHLGHQYLIGQVLEHAKKDDAESVIVTMYPHPIAVLQPGKEPKLLTTIEEKTKLLGNMGIDRVEILPFDKQMSKFSAPEFMSEILRRKLGIDTLVMGYDHKFGCGGGSFSQYVDWGKSVHMNVCQAKPMPDFHVSSSAIRKLLEKGEVEKAIPMLGRPYELNGIVVGGYKVGRTIGFPTANITPHEGKLVPCCGVYAVWVMLSNGERYKGMLNIGKRPTLSYSNDVSVEVNLLNFTGDLYNQPLRLVFVGRLRNEKRFDSLKELQFQLKQDAVEAKQLLK